MLARLYKLDHLYGLTFGLALSSGLLPARIGSTRPALFRAAAVRHAAWASCSCRSTASSSPRSSSAQATWFVIDAQIGRLSARSHPRNPPRWCRTFGINVPRMITLTYGFGVALAAARRVIAAPISPVSPQMGRPHHRRVRRGRDRRHGRPSWAPSLPASAWGTRGPDQGVLPRGLDDRHLHHHGHRAADPSGRLVWHRNKPGHRIDPLPPPSPRLAPPTPAARADDAPSSSWRRWWSSVRWRRCRRLRCS